MLEIFRLFSLTDEASALERTDSFGALKFLLETLSSARRGITEGHALLVAKKYHPLIADRDEKFMITAFTARCKRTHGSPRDNNSVCPFKESLLFEIIPFSPRPEVETYTSKRKA